MKEEKEKKEQWFKLRERFVKDTKLPIPVTDERIFKLRRNGEIWLKW